MRDDPWDVPAGGERTEAEDATGGWVVLLLSLGSVAAGALALGTRWGVASTAAAVLCLVWGILMTGALQMIGRERGRGMK